MVFFCRSNLEEYYNTVAGNLVETNPRPPSGRPFLSSVTLPLTGKLNQLSNLQFYAPSSFQIFSEAFMNLASQIS
ncbi:hypothetical protein BVC80_1531g1 [Macleaya cordata]|uniref:Uncharacterized protein n=1 Tax=Macleaya cordata TaxID=56857 RepID=A0A200R9M7_MACCD|nr:hypothetical protein BVC80_1531g1 [Macleaya cordata]